MSSANDVSVGASSACAGCDIVVPEDVLCVSTGELTSTTEIPASARSSVLLHFDLLGGLPGPSEDCLFLGGLPRFLGTGEVELMSFPISVGMGTDVDATSSTGTADLFFGGRPRRLGAKVH